MRFSADFFGEKQGGTNADSHWFPCMFFKRFPFMESLIPHVLIF